MHKIKTRVDPAAVDTTFEIRSHSYPTRFSSISCSKPKTRLCKSRLKISIGDPVVLNSFVANTKKELESSSLFKAKVKTKLLDFENKVTFVLYFFDCVKLDT